MHAVVHKGSLATTLTQRGHQLVADEPTDHGGHDAGPDPFDYVMMGLAACTTISLRAVADRHDIPLERAEVHIHYGRRSGDDDGPRHVMKKVVQLHGSFTDDQLKRLERAAACPVHRMLTTGVDVQTETETVEGR